MESVAYRICSAIRELLNQATDFVPMVERRFPPAYAQEVAKVLEAGWVSVAGEATAQFEKELELLHSGCKVVATNSGTAALHLSLLASEIKPYDEVLLPAFSFAATANTVLYCQANPHFIDVDKDTLTINCTKLENYLAKITRKNQAGETINKRTGQRIKALIAVYPYGFPPQLDDLAAVCQAYNLTLIEDAAGALGTTYKQKNVGSWGRFAILSFNGNKMLTTGGGGAVVCRSSEDARKVKYLARVAKENKAVPTHGALGYNYAMPALNAALGLAQLKDINLILAGHERYFKAVGRHLLSEVQLILPNPEANPNFWLPIIKLPESCNSVTISEELASLGIATSFLWQSLPTFPYLRHLPSDSLEGAKQISQTYIALPMYRRP